MSATLPWCLLGCGISGTEGLLVLGIDPGLRRTGFGLVRLESGHQRWVGSGTIQTGDGSTAERLAKIVEGIDQLIQSYKPDEAAVEEVFVNVNPRSTLLLGQARGAAIAALALHKLPVHEYAAMQIKQSIAGHGRAAKAQMQFMVQRLLSLEGSPTPDAADALACALYHLQSRKLGALQALAYGRGRLLARKKR
jgi:crossover junction endodeoxyribonuclease RuvC